MTDIQIWSYFDISRVFLIYRRLFLENDPNLSENPEIEAKSDYKYEMTP